MNGASPDLPDKVLVRAAIERADELRQEKRLQEGVDVLIDSLKAGIEVAEIHYRLGNIRVDEGSLDAAEACYKNALAADPHHENAMHNLAVVYKRQGRIGRFVRTYKRSRRLAHDRIRAPGEAPRWTKALSGGRGRALILVVGIAGTFLLVWAFTR